MIFVKIYLQGVFLNLIVISYRKAGNNRCVLTEGIVTS